MIKHGRTIALGPVGPTESPQPEGRKLKSEGLRSDPVLATASEQRKRCLTSINAGGAFVVFQVAMAKFGFWRLAVPSLLPGFARE
jgi:hypothetical protein